MLVKLLTEHHLEFLSLKGGCRGLSESAHVKMAHCVKSHDTAHIVYRSKAGKPGLVWETRVYLGIGIVKCC